MRAALDGVLEHCRFIMGPEVAAAESELADYVGVDQCLVCSSGTDALLLPLMAWDIGPGTRYSPRPSLLLPRRKWFSLLGATPVFVDIDPKTYNIDPERLREAVDQVKREGKLRPAAVIPVDLFGLPADYDPIMDVAEENGLKVLEDAAQGFGGVYKSRRACSFGHAAATSFFPAKPLGCYGDGGAVFTNDKAMVEKMVSPAGPRPGHP